MSSSRQIDQGPSGAGGFTAQRSRLAVAAAVALVGGLVVAPAGAGADEQHLTGAVFGIDATPDGGFLVTENRSVMEVRDGQVTTVAELPTAHSQTGGQFGAEAVAPVNGVAAIGRGNFFATTGGLDSAEGAGLWRVSHGNARLVGDVEAFAHANDVDATEGDQWKDQRCEAADGWTAGPQSNPYQLTALSGSDVLIADAAGNSLLTASTNGVMDWVAVFPPAYDENGEWLVQHELAAGAELWGDITLEEDLTCYVQPVPTAVAVGPDGAYYVSELTGTPPDPGGDPEGIAGLSRVWRVDAGARNVTCPSPACELVVDGLTSVVDAEFGPDGRLYVVEMDVNGWFVAVVPGLEDDMGGGAVKACDVGTGECDIVEDDLVTPSALTFDRQGGLWVVDSMFASPQIVPVDLG